MVTFSAEFLERDLLEALDNTPRLLFRNLKVAYRRSMGRFRSSFIRRSPVLDSSDARPSSPGASAAKGSRGLDRTFRWVVTPKTGRVDQLRARFWSESFAAFGLETRQAYRARRGKYIAIPIQFALGKGGRPKRAYRSMRKRVEERGGFASGNFRSIPRGRNHVVWEAIQRGRRRKDGSRAKRWKPVYLLTPATMRPRKHLGMFKEWDRFQPRVLFRVREAVGRTLEGRFLR